MDVQIVVDPDDFDVAEKTAVVADGLSGAIVADQIDRVQQAVERSRGVFRFTGGESVAVGVVNGDRAVVAALTDQLQILRCGIGVEIPEGDFEVATYFWVRCSKAESVCCSCHHTKEYQDREKKDDEGYIAFVASRGIQGVVFSCCRET